MLLVCSGLQQPQLLKAFSARSMYDYKSWQCCAEVWMGMQVVQVEMSEQGVSRPQARSSDMQLTVQSSAGASAVLEFEDPRELPVEERLQQVCLIG